MAKTSDPYVLNVQQWVNEHFSNEEGYDEIPETGNTGWTTIYGLIHALQITLEVGAIADNYGEATNLAYKNFIMEIGDIKERDDSFYINDYDNLNIDELESLLKSSTNESEKIKVRLQLKYKRVCGIIQGALLCKGYGIGTNKPTCNFYSGTGNAIKNLKSDAGLLDTTTIVTPHVMKSLMSMDYFYSYDTSEKTLKTINIQRYLNQLYEDYYDEIYPCDGVYSRRTNKALIFAIQCEEGIPSYEASGSVGNKTKLCLPEIPYSGSYKKDGITYGLNYNGKAYTSSDINKFTILANFALYFNGLGSGSISSTLDSSIVKEFQKNLSIPETGKIDYSTWLSLLISCGDITRSTVACDTATIITEDNIDVLLNNGYKYIGRYLHGTAQGGVSKALSTEELQLLFNNGIRVFPIQQRSANSTTYFNDGNAKLDATNAAMYADSLNLQFGAIIYFAVDYDAQDSEITNYILPYFKTLHETFMNLSKGKYRVGVYGTRNLCKRVSDAGYACSSFVGDMSTGFSGNLGFNIPDNWAFDQFNETEISYNGKTLAIDKDGFSGRNFGISQEYSSIVNNVYDQTSSDGSIARLLVNRGGASIPVYESKKHKGAATTPMYEVTGKKIGEIKVNDFYLRYAVQSPQSDNVHRVMFNNGIDVLQGYIVDRNVFDYDVSSGKDPIEAINDAQILPYQEYLPTIHYNIDTKKYTKDDFEEDHYLTINKPVPYFSTNGAYEGMLNRGDIIVISFGNVSNCGASRPWCIRVSKLIKAGTDEEISFIKYVSSGLEYGASGDNRAWL